MATQSCPHCGRKLELDLDTEFLVASIGTSRARLSQLEFRLLELLVGANRPLYTDWLLEQLEVPESTYWKILHRLRRKVGKLGLEIVNLRPAYQTGAYALSARRPELAA
jgi:hypothetical protein